MLNSKDLILFFKTQIDKVRANPKDIIPLLQNRLQRFNEKGQYRHSQLHNINFKTQQGPLCVKQAILYLEKEPKKQALGLSGILCQVAYEIGKKMAEQKHIITDFSPYRKEIQLLIQKHTQRYDGEITMILQYGFRQDRDIIPSLIIDDGNQRRLKRHTLMNPHSKIVGIGVHQHQQFDYLLLILFADGDIHQTESECRCLIF